MINGVPWVIPPPWIDPHQRPVRNTLHDDEHTAHHLATHLGDQLTLDLGEEPPGAGGTQDVERTVGSWSTGKFTERAMKQNSPTRW